MESPRAARGQRSRIAPRSDGEKTPAHPRARRSQARPREDATVASETSASVDAAIPFETVTMLRAALIGFGAVGKTTLFELMTSAKESGRPAAHGKLEASIGISKVPDERLER